MGQMQYYRLSVVNIFSMRQRWVLLNGRNVAYHHKKPTEDRQKSFTLVGYSKRIAITNLKLVLVVNLFIWN